MGLAGLCRAFAARSSTPPLRRGAPEVKCGGILLSTMDNAEPMAMCMSRYLYVPKRPPNNTDDSPLARSRYASSFSRSACVFTG